MGFPATEALAKSAGVKQPNLEQMSNHAKAFALCLCGLMLHVFSIFGEGCNGWERHGRGECWLCVASGAPGSFVLL